ncbi:MAG TPA: tetratricopeptide repeat protein, partial [Patescibacteria group bacterium]|nr:tetratricopeptide repeat protein [Patescibacteria group bacterium]
MLRMCVLLAGMTGLLGSATNPVTYNDAVQEARKALARGDDMSALSMLDGALRQNPDGAEGFMLLGQAYRRLGRLAEAEVVLRRAVTLLGEATHAGQDAMFELAASLGDQQKNEDAITMLRRVIALAPTRAGAHANLGAILLAIGRLAESQAEFRQEIALHTGGGRDEALSSAYAGLGVAAYQAGDDEAALEALAKAPDTLAVRYHLGLALARRGRHEEAAVALREVLKRDPDHRGALQNLARVDSSLGLEDERKRSLERFGQLYHEEESRRTLRIRVRDLRKQADDRIAANDVAGAISAMEQAARLSPDEVEILLDLGRLYLRAGETARAEQAYRLVLTKDPLRAEGHYRLGRIQTDRGDLAGAAGSLEQAARLEPMAVPYHLALAQIYLRLDRGDQGVRELRLARRLSPDDPAASFNLGLGLAQSGSLREAA